MTSPKLSEKLDKLIDKLLTDAEAGEMDNEQKIDIFKEGVRWAAVKSKIGLDEPIEDTGRLASFKKSLKGRK